MFRTRKVWILSLLGLTAVGPRLAAQDRAATVISLRSAAIDTTNTTAANRPQLVVTYQ